MDNRDPRPSPMSYNRSVEAKIFDDFVTEVEDLTNSGFITIPSVSINPPQALNEMKASPPLGVTIPTVDLSGVDSDERPTIVNKVSHAAREFGFFQVVNHGVPSQLMNRAVGGIKGFHEQSTEVNKNWYNKDTGMAVTFFSNADLFNAKAASWKDMLKIYMGPKLAEIESIPEIRRKDFLEWEEEAKRVAGMLMELLCEGLRVEKERLKNFTCSEGRMMVGHYNPPCPQPDLTLGISSHKDPGVLTVLLQDHIGGLQVKYGDEWLDVKPQPGALVFNIGDVLQIMSNEEYKSVEHRMLANPSSEARISIAISLHPSESERLLGPFPELITTEKAAKYRQFTFEEFLRQFLVRDLADDKALTDYFKL